VKVWFLSSLVALVMWAFWGFLPKLATRYVGPKSVLVYEVIGAILVGFVVLVLLNFNLEFQPWGALFGVIAGVAGLAGTLFFLFALKQGEAAIVVPMTALYPLGVILLSFVVLHEPITLKQGLGVLLALISILLLAG